MLYNLRIMNQNTTYLDYSATTPLDQRVLDAMMPFLSHKFGNPSSIHSYGQQAEYALENAREMVASILNCSPEEIIFTSGGTESDNLALRGIALHAKETRNANRILISPVEHHAITHTALQLEKYYGFRVEIIPVNRDGVVQLEYLDDMLGPDVAIVSTIYANNEIGSINPIPEIGRLCRSKDIPFHTDAVQACAYLSLDVKGLLVDSLSIGAHKFYGPKGVGVLFLRKDIQAIPTQTGGGQELGRRAGTHNIPYIVGLAEALRYVVHEREATIRQLEPLRNRLIGTILEEYEDVELTGHPNFRLPNHASFVFKGLDGNKLITALDIAGYACSSGSACKTGDPEPSNVLTALGYSREWALGSLRVTLGKQTSPLDIDQFLNVLPEIVKQLRHLSE